MKRHNPLLAGNAGALPTVERKSVVVSSKGIRPATAYASLLASPLALLAGHVMDRPDVQSIAILGYN